MDDDEKFYDLKGYEGLYQINKLGQVKSLEKMVGFIKRKETILKPQLDTCGYFRVTLCKNGKQKRKSIHRLLMETFVLNPKNLPCVDHKNRNTKDNRLSNLRWASNSDNCVNVKVYGKIPHKFIYQTKKGNNEYYKFVITSRGNKNIQKSFNKKKYTLQQVIEWRDKYCWDKDIKIIE